MEELRERMSKAANEISTMMGIMGASLIRTSEYTRLSGKRDGILLCLSYLDETIRTTK